MMEVAMSLNPLVRLPLSNSRTHHQEDSSFIIRHSLFSKTAITQKPYKQSQNGGAKLLVVEAKGKKGMSGRQYQPKKAPPVSKIPDDGNPRFVIFIRMANVSLWYPLNIVNGGTSAKIILSAKDTYFGKYIYKETLARNLAAVVYKEEKELQKTAMNQHRVLRSATEFRYGYKLIENNNMRAALSTTDVIELPTKEQLATVFDKVKDFFGDAKESFGKLTAINPVSESSEEDSSK